MSNIPGRMMAAFVLVGTMLVLSATSAGAAWVNATGNLTGQPTECGDLQSIWAVPNVNLTITGVANNGLYGTTDGGTNWIKMSGNTVTVRMTQMTFDPDHPNTWWAGGIYHTPAIVKTTDAGATWTAVSNNSIATSDHFSIDFTDPQRNTIIASGHEQRYTLWKTTNGGSTWTNIGLPGLTADSGYSSFPFLINAQTYLMGIQNFGVFRTTDSGVSWTQVSSTAPISCILKTAAGDLYYTGSNNKVLKGSSDGSTWTILNSSTAVCVPVELPGGKIAVMNANGMAISADKGTTWTSNRCRPLPTQISGFWNFNGGALGIAYNSVAGSFYTFYWNCTFSNATIGTDQIWRFDTTISSSTEVSAPRIAPSLMTGPSILPQGNTAVFDVSGRVVNRHIADAGLALRPGAVYIVKTDRGSFVKGICRN